MAEDESTPPPKTGGEAGSEGSRAKKFLIMAGAAVVIGAGAGYAVAQMLAGPSAAPQSQPATDPDAPGPGQPADGDGGRGYLDFEMEPVNLNVPRKNRYVVATFTLAFDLSNAKVVTAAVEGMDPNLRNWLTTYLANLTLEDVGGKKNLNRICREVQDEFNKRLWPDGKALIKEILLKKFIIS